MIVEQRATTTTVITAIIFERVRIQSLPEKPADEQEGDNGSEETAQEGEKGGVTGRSALTLTIWEIN